MKPKLSPTKNLFLLKQIKVYNKFNKIPLKIYNYLYNYIKGNLKLVSDGFAYNKEGKENKNGKQMWKCERCNVTVNCPARCLARVHTIGTQGSIVSMWSNEDDIRCHNHKR